MRRIPSGSSSIGVFNTGGAKRTYVLYCRHAGGVPRGAVQERPQPRPRHAVRLVAQPLHGLRAPLHVLLRPRVRAAGGPAGRRPLRAFDPGEDERRRGAPAELARRSWRSEAIAIGAATDPYQPAEGRYRLTRSCLEVLRGAANPFSLITRGPLVVRDVDVLAEASSARGRHGRRSPCRPSTRTSGGRLSRGRRRRGSACAR